MDEKKTGEVTVRVTSCILVSVSVVFLLCLGLAAERTLRLFTGLLVVFV
jgi:hypothetical protein